MANALLGYDNLVLSSVITAGVEEAAMGVANLAGVHGDFSSGWQTTNGVKTSAGGSWFLLDSNNVSAVWRVFGLFRSNLSPSAQVRWRVATNSAMTSPVYDSGTILANVAPGFQQSLHVLSSQVSGRYVRCDIDDSTNPDNFINVPLAFAGPVWQPVFNITFATVWQPQRELDLVETLGGQRHVQPRWRARSWEFAVDRITESEVWQYHRPMELFAAQGRNLLLIPDPASPTLGREAVFGMLAPVSVLGYVSNLRGLRSWRARITERL